MGIHTFDRSIKIQLIILRYAIFKYNLTGNGFWIKLKKWRTATGNHHSKPPLFFKLCSAVYFLHSFLNIDEYSHVNRVSITYFLFFSAGEHVIRNAYTCANLIPSKNCYKVVYLEGRYDIEITTIVTCAMNSPQCCQVSLCTPQVRCGAYAGETRRCLHLATVLIRPPSCHRPGKRQGSEICSHGTQYNLAHAVTLPCRVSLVMETCRCVRQMSKV